MTAPVDLLRGPMSVFAAIKSRTIGDLSRAKASTDIDARGLAVAPGFINMLSWATESLIQDPRSQSDIRQGVTLEVMGEGESMGPLNPSMKKLNTELQGDIKYDISWTTLGEYLEFLEKKGISANVASFVGATTVRIHELGYADRAPTPEELDRMRALVRAGDGGGGARRRLLTHLRPRVLCQDGRTDCARAGSGKIRRDVHLAHPQRGKRIARSR